VNELCLAFVLGVVLEIIFLILLKKGKDFYRSGRALTAIFTFIAGFLLAFMDGESLVFSSLFGLALSFMAYWTWPTYYRMIKNTEWIREKRR